MTNEKSDTPEAMRPVPQNAPVLRAWNIYKQSADYANTRKWAKHDEHVDGSLWAAFYAGYFACAVAESAQAPVAGEVANLLDELDERVSYIDHMGTGSVKSGKAEEKEWFDFTARLRAAVQSLSAQVEALKRERDQMESDLREIIGSCNVHYRAVCAAEQRADRLQAELDARTK